MTIYLSLIWEFIKTGLFAIGGGLAALPFITDIGQRTIPAEISSNPAKVNGVSTGAFAMAKV